MKGNVNGFSWLRSIRGLKRHFRFSGRGSCVSLLLPALLACSGEKETTLQCSDVDVGAGTWSYVELPGEDAFIPGKKGLSDGRDFILLDSYCYTCSLWVLEPHEAVWSSTSFVRETFLSHPGLRAISEAFVFDLGWRESPPLPTVRTVELIDRATLKWSSYEAPSALKKYFTHVHAAGEQFIIWGGSEEVSPDSIPTVDADDPMVYHYDGALFDPRLLEWTEIPPAREPGHYLWGDGGPSPASLWTEAGLFVWGMTPDRRGTWGAIFDVDAMAWRELEVDNVLPPLRIEAKLLTVGLSVYLYGGMTPSGEPSRRLFRYDLNEGVWTELEVPVWADPMQGAVVDEKLVFLGRCASGARFDPKTGRWDELAAKGRPPSQGFLQGAGSFLTVIDVYVGESETDAVWFLDLRE